MIIIFEGNENTGKTNISKQLSKEINIPYFKNKVELNNPIFIETIDFEEEIKYIWRFLISFMKQIKCDAIFDRGYITEYVYGNVLRKENFEKKNIEKYIFKYDEILSEMDCKLIFCYKDHHSEDDYIDTKIMPEIDEYYKKYLQLTKLKNLQLNTTDCDLTNQIKKIKQFIYE